MAKAALSSKVSFPPGATMSSTNRRGEKRPPARRNPFEEKQTKSKFDILGKKVRGTRGLPAVSKHRALEHRSSTLLLQHRTRNRNTAFVDRRFGENSRELSMEEKMLERFSKEQQRKSSGKGKAGLFQLGEGRDDEQLTHLGQSLSQLDNEMMGDQSDNEFSDDEGQLDASIVGHSHFGGFQNPTIDASQSRSKKEIMQEVMAKSKFYRHEKQRIREENAELCDTINVEFDEIRGRLEKRTEARDHKQSKVDDYDAMVRAMAFEERANPTDRTKTTGELAQALDEKHMELEEARARRMAKEDNEASGSEDEKQADLLKPVSGSDKKLAESKERLGKLLIDFCGSATFEDAEKPFDEIKKLITRKDILVEFGRIMRSKIEEIHRKFAKQLLNGKNAPPPTVETLLLFHLIGKIFSTSDFHHVVVTPAQILIGYILESVRLSKPAHVLRTLFLCSTLLQYQSVSKRFMPELINMLTNILSRFGSAQSSDKSANTSSIAISTHLEVSLKQTIPESAATVAIDVADLRSAENELGENMRATILKLSLKLAEHVIALYTDLPAFPELIKPIQDSIHSMLKTVQHHTGLEDICKAVSKSIADATASATATRNPLLLQKHKPIPLPTLAPKFETDSFDQRSASDNRDERNQARLKRAYKKEFRGAQRELRLDNAFLAREKLTKVRSADQDYQTKMKRIYGMIGNESVEDGFAKKKR